VDQTQRPGLPGLPPLPANGPLSLPPPFIERLGGIVPAAHWADVWASFSQAKAVSFRVNRLLTTADQVVEQLQQAGLDFHGYPWLADAFFVPAPQRAALTRHALVASGQIYIHNPSSMLAALILDPQPEETVLDLAAAPGGKTLHLAAQMQGKGFLSAVEPVQARFYKLKENLRRGGAAWVRTYQLDGRRVPQKTGPRFDRVLLDAPCSGEARFHALSPAAAEKWNLRKIRECQRKQRGLIQAAWEALRPGGRLLYCTCSFAPEENEMVVAGLLAERAAECQILDIPLPIDHWQAGLTAWLGQSFAADLQACRRILPNQQHDGLFLALLEKRLPAA
jgi:16S rRNA C967 or C1407 C5-methylase (RsmB/RsmF family)